MEQMSQQKTKVQKVGLAELADHNEIGAGSGTSHDRHQSERRSGTAGNLDDGNR